MEQQEYERHFKAMYNAGLAPTLIGKPQAGFEKADLFAGRSNAKRALPLSALMQTVICSQSNGFDPMIGIELDVSRTELIVVDVDSKSPRLQSAVIKRFGSTPWKENTPRGLHFF